MSSEKKSVSTIDKIAGFIVDKRKAFYLVFLAAVIFCGASISKVVICPKTVPWTPIPGT